MKTKSGIEIDLLIGLASSAIAVAAEFVMFGQVLSTTVILKNFVSSTIGSFVVRKVIAKFFHVQVRG